MLHVTRKEKQQRQARACRRFEKAFDVSLSEVIGNKNSKFNAVLEIALSEHKARQRN